MPSISEKSGVEGVFRVLGANISLRGRFSIKNIDFEPLSSSGNPRAAQRPHYAPKFFAMSVSAGQAWLFIVSPHLHK